uniref:Uncharacterized protein n=1 Tax=Pyramimonas obovata TaxID=1411642 RepID=A0A7S0WTE4_9CHLO|mmetsp:Transcript_39178/g.85232  ORF Transcript_39178/g.85232 Transcript_39178/m.85232 type:complete len:390 (+) Transcript_39178:168-1337(+)
MASTEAEGGGAAPPIWLDRMRQCVDPNFAPNLVQRFSGVLSTIEHRFNSQRHSSGRPRLCRPCFATVSQNQGLDSVNSSENVSSGQPANRMEVKSISEKARKAKKAESAKSFAVCQRIERECNMEEAAKCYNKIAQRHGKESDIGNEAFCREAKVLSDIGWQAISASQGFPTWHAAVPAPGTKEEGAELLERSAKMSEMATAIRPDEVMPRLTLAFNYGRLAIQADNRKKVELCGRIHQEAELATKIDPHDDNAHHALGRWNYEVASINQVVRLIVRHFYGGDVSGSYKDAIFHYEKAVKLNPKKLVHHFELAKALLQVKQKKRAIKCMKRAMSCPCEDINDQLGKLHCAQLLNSLTTRKRLGERLGVRRKAIVQGYYPDGEDESLFIE